MLTNSLSSLLQAQDSTLGDALLGSESGLEQLQRYESHDELDGSSDSSDISEHADCTGHSVYHQATSDVDASSSVLMRRTSQTRPDFMFVAEPTPQTRKRPVNYPELPLAGRRRSMQRMGQGTIFDNSESLAPASITGRRTSLRFSSATPERQQRSSLSGARVQRAKYSSINPPLSLSRISIKDRMKRKSRQTSNIPLSCSTGVIVSHGTLSAQATSSQAHCTPTHPLEPFSQSRTPSKRHPQKSAEFWLLDGSVVIQIDDTVFRLYRSHLARRSPFFAALFAQGEPPAHYDSHPLYTVTSVSVNDFTELLRAEDIGMYVLRCLLCTFPALAALLRAAHTLDFRSWRSFAIRHLQASAPPSLSIRLPHAAQTLALARACGLRSVAKRALYELMRTPAFGQRPSEDSDDEDMYADEFAEAADRLSSADIFMLFRALRKAQRVWMRVVRTPPLPSIVPCPLDLLGDALALSQGPMREACQVARAQADMGSPLHTGQDVRSGLARMGVLCGVRGGSEGAMGGREREALEENGPVVRP